MCFAGANIQEQFTHLSCFIVFSKESRYA